MKVPVRRCALYTRKSSEEGLEQNFNSLLAQREACAAYVKSQASEGWRALEARYDDGGFSGGSMERPALQRLLADIAVGKVDVVVVYKIDRLTQALTDFARMVEIFDRHEVSFVSVTQAFNTTSSMGRLTLNVLLSFAQFEREVTGERIRDKIAASKARGMWMGGNLPLGYNLPVEGQRALVLNEAEAETVQASFMKYRELGSVRALQHWLVAQGIHSKRRTTANGRTIGGDPFTRGALFYMLRNRTYLGMIVHRDKLHAGMHPAIVDADLFEAVQRQLDVNARQRRMRGNQHPPAPLKGRVFDADGRAMSPTFAYGQQKKCYRYYASPAPQLGRRADRDRTIRRIPAQALEAKLAEIVRRVASAGPSDPLSLLTRVEVYPDALHLLMPIDLLPAMRNRIMQDERLDRDLTDPTQLRLMLPVRLQFHGGRTRIISGAEPGGRPDPVLVKALRAAHAMLGRDAAGHGSRGGAGLDLPSPPPAAGVSRPRATARDLLWPPAGRHDPRCAVRRAPAAALDRADRRVRSGRARLNRPSLRSSSAEAARAAVQTKSLFRRFPIPVPTHSGPCSAESNTCSAEKQESGAKNSNPLILRD